MKSEQFERSIGLEVRSMDEDKRTVELAFSSEEPVERWFGSEILDHSREAADLSRLNSRAALLVNHDPDQHVGVVENARIDEDRRGRATVRFGRSERATEIFNDVRDGIRPLVSFGYRIMETKEERSDDKDSDPVVRVTRWQPMEISIVSVPADNTVGVGRSIEQTQPIPEKREEKVTVMPEETKAPAPEPKVDIQAIRAEAQKSERTRQTEINAIAERMAKHNPEAASICKAAIERGDSIDEVRKQVFESMPNVKPVNPKDTDKIGMSERDLSKYSIRKAALEAAEGKLSGLEREISDEWTKRVDRSPGSFWIPPDVLQHQQRDLLVGTATLGGNLVATNLLAGSFIDLLRNRMAVARLGAQYLSGLVGNVAIPRQTGGVTTYWVTEAQATTESNAAFDQVTLTPRGLTALQDVSKNLLIQSTPSVEQLIRNDLAIALALAMDAAAINGAGTAGQPTGILATSGIGSVSSGTAGGALTWANVVALETEVSQDNADIGSLGYLTNAKVRGAAKGIEKASGTAQFIWADSAAADLPGAGMVNGYRAVVSNQVPSTLTESTTSNLSALALNCFCLMPNPKF